MNKIDMDVLSRIAKAVATQFGSNCEVVVHDLTGDDMEQTIAYIENGHVTKRELGAGPSMVVLEAMKEHGKKIPDHLNYITKTQDGRILRSSTVYIKNEKGKPEAIFSINYDMTDILMAQSIVGALAQNGSDGDAERIPTNVNELLDDLLEQSVRIVGKPVAMMNKDDKVKAIAFLNDAGALLITKSGDKIANYFGISKYTLYSYLDNGKEG